MSMLSEDRTKQVSKEKLSLLAKLRLLARDIKGVAAVEFAMLLPLLMTLYIGTVEISQGVTIDRKVTITARTLADLVSQSTVVTNADMNNIFAAINSVMLPFQTTTLSAVVSAVNINAAGVAKIAWSDGHNASARAVNSTVVIPAALAVPNTQLIWGEVRYAYTPTIGYVIAGALNLSDQNFVRPRQSSTITRTP